MIKLSPSRLKTFRQCPRCFWLLINKNIKLPESIFPSLPSGMDLVFKRWYDAHRIRRQLPPELLGKISESLYPDQAQLDAWRSTFKGLRLEIDGVLVSGAIDELLIDPQDFQLSVLDFKTRGFPPKSDGREFYGDQQDIYSLLFQSNGYPMSDHGYLIYYWPEIMREDGHPAATDFNCQVCRLEVSPARALDLIQSAIDCLKDPLPEMGTECDCCRFLEESGAFMIGAGNLHPS